MQYVAAPVPEVHDRIYAKVDKDIFIGNAYITIFTQTFFMG